METKMERNVNWEKENCVALLVVYGNWLAWVLLDSFLFCLVPRNGNGRVCIFMNS